MDSTLKPDIPAANESIRRVPKSKSMLGIDRGEQGFQALVVLAGAVLVGAIVLLVVLLTANAQLTLQRYGLNFITGTLWDSGAEEFGALSFIYGTFVTALIALVIATPLGVGGAIFINEYAPRRVGQVTAFVIELLVSIPSVVYGLWGVAVMAPFLRDTVSPWIQSTFGKIPVIGETLFGGSLNGGRNLFTAGLILAIMILPTILSISREVLAQVPRAQLDGMLALGSTKWESIRFGLLPYAQAGVVGALLLGLARAIGETMAVLMLGGSGGTRPDGINTSIFSAGSTIASRIASAATESYLPLDFSAVVELGLVLIVLASIFNIIARQLVRRLSASSGTR